MRYFPPYHQVHISHGLLYGHVNSDSQPHQDPYSKWYITLEVTCLDLFFFNLIRLGKHLVLAQGSSLYSCGGNLSLVSFFIRHVELDA
jgi:hypothetical protein